MKKILLVTLLLILVLGGATYWFFDNLDDFIKNYMVENGSKMTKTEVEVDSVKTDFQKGEISINRLGIENPNGFSNSEAFEVEKVMISINKESLTQDIIEIPLVLINNPEIIYEYNGKKTNFNVLKENIQSYQNNGSNISQEKKSTKTTENKEIKDTNDKKTPKTFFIKELKIVDLEIKARVSSLKKDFLNKKIPLIVIKDIGSKSQGASPEFILERVILKVDDNLETVFDFKSLKTDIRKNINKIIDKLSGEEKADSDEEKIDPKKIINNLKDLL
ncbi:MAG: AsmA family protein [Nitrosomonadales bacterium]|nr:AsmA family protein [Nitrosomonadales bacterium]